MPQNTKTLEGHNKTQALKPRAETPVKQAPIKPSTRADKTSAPAAIVSAPSQSLETKRPIEQDQGHQAGAAPFAAAESESPLPSGQVTLPGKEPDTASASAARLTPELTTKDDLPAATRPEPITSVRSSKKSMLIGLLQRPEGASINQLVKELAWLPHTVRAAITGLRKSGYPVGRKALAGGSSTYVIAATVDASSKQSS